MQDLETQDPAAEMQEPNMEIPHPIPNPFVSSDAVPSNSCPSAVAGPLIATNAISELLGEIQSDWFKAALSVLKAASLGDQWNAVLHSNINQEARSGFVNPKGTNCTLSSKGHPSEVDWWIAWACRLNLTIKDPTVLVKKILGVMERTSTKLARGVGCFVAAYECSPCCQQGLGCAGQAQPEWLLVRDGRFELVGQSIVAWEVSSVLTNHEWLEACRDVQWVMDSIVLVPVPE
jgi:hypothetical protein